MDGSLNEVPAESQSEQALGAFLTKLQSRLAMALLGDELLRVADGNSGTGSDMLASATYFTTACIIAAGGIPGMGTGHCRAGRRCVPRDAQRCRPAAGRASRARPLNRGAVMTSPEQERLTALTGRIEARMAEVLAEAAMLNIPHPLGASVGAFIVAAHRHPEWAAQVTSTVYAAGHAQGIDHLWDLPDSIPPDCPVVEVPL